MGVVGVVGVKGAHGHDLILLSLSLEVHGQRTALSHRGTMSENRFGYIASQ